MTALSSLSDLPYWYHYEGATTDERAQVLYRVAYLLNSIGDLDGAPCRAAFEAAREQTIKAYGIKAAAHIDEHIGATSDPSEFNRALKAWREIEATPDCEDCGEEHGGESWELTDRALCYICVSAVTTNAPQEWHIDRD